ASTDIQVGGFPGVSSSSNFPGPVGVLELDNSAALNPDRLPDNATLTLTGGAFSYIGRNASGASTETVGTIHLARGQSYIRSVVGSTTGATNAVTAASLVRDAGATVDFSGANLGSASNRILFSTAPTLTNNILPYATVAGADFAVYNQGGQTGLSAPASGFYATNLATAGANDVVLLTSSTTLSASTTVAGLVLRGSPQLTVSPGAKLTLGNALLTGGSSGQVIGGGTLTFGPEGIIHRFASTTINTSITGSTALTLAGTGSLDLGPAAGNS